MMNVLEYAIDVNKSSEEIIELCKKLGIKVLNKNDMLTEDDIIILDNALGDDNNEEVELDNRVEKILDNENINIDLGTTKKEKLKTKVDLKNESKESFVKGRKQMYKHRDKLMSNNEDLADVILYHNGMTVSELADALKVNASVLVKKLFDLGVITNINQSLNYADAEVLLLDYNKTLKMSDSVDISNFEKYEILDNDSDLVKRAPVVTIMGHVDHGKTTLLDTIRKTDVVSGEAGGITQAIGAYQVNIDGNNITFIDTPGHAAFTQMRARGASVTDIVVIIVAADDGVMPQTKEAIDHAKAANVPIIVAINKIDKPGSNIDRVMTGLVEAGLTPEEWGGDVLVSRISAKTGEGVDGLLSNISLIAEMLELKANPNRYATGTVIEARMDKSIGSVVSLLIQNGTLRLSDPIVVGTSYGKVRSLKNDKGEDITSAGPSTPVEVTGITELPSSSDKFMAFETEKQARSVSDERKLRAKDADTNKSGISLDDLFNKIQEGVKEINVVLKTDVKGSEEAVKGALDKINIDNIAIKVIRSGVGTITESDVVLANASDAIVIGFNVRPSSKVVEVAKGCGVDIRLYDIIYKLVEEMESAIKGMLDPEFVEKVTGKAEVRKLFRFSKVGVIAGSHVTSGIIKQNSDVRVIRDGIVIYTGKINTIQREKDQVKEVKEGMDCGITVVDYQDIKENDVFESFEMVKVE